MFTIYHYLRSNFLSCYQDYIFIAKIAIKTTRCENQMILFQLEIGFLQIQNEKLASLQFRLTSLFQMLFQCSCHTVCPPPPQMIHYEEKPSSGHDSTNHTGDHYKLIQCFEDVTELSILRSSPSTVSYIFQGVAKTFVEYDIIKMTAFDHPPPITYSTQSLSYDWLLLPFSKTVRILLQLVIQLMFLLLI